MLPRAELVDSPADPGVHVVAQLRSDQTARAGEQGGQQGEHGSAYFGQAT
jgi:hypothetical protein